MIHLACFPICSIFGSKRQDPIFSDIYQNVPESVSFPSPLFSHFQKPWNPADPVIGYYHHHCLVMKFCFVIVTCIMNIYRRVGWRSSLGWLMRGICHSSKENVGSRANSLAAGLETKCARSHLIGSRLSIVD